MDAVGRKYLEKRSVTFREAVRERMMFVWLTNEM